MKNFRNSDVIRSWCIRDGVRAMLPQRRLAGVLLFSICSAAYAVQADRALLPSDRIVSYGVRPDGGSSGPGPVGNGQDNPGEVLKRTLEITAGGPYVAEVGVPITLHGKYTVTGQTENSDQLKIIGQALQSYLKHYGSYPPAALLNAWGQRTVSWRVLILPYLGEKALYDRFDLSKPWDDSVNVCLLREMPAVYRKSGAQEHATETGFAGVEGVNSLFQNASAELNCGRPLSGITQTEKIAAGPVGEAVHLPWTAPGDVDIAKVTQLGSPDGFSGEGNAFTPLLFLDGTVHLVPDNVGAGPMNMWTHISSSNGRIPCAPPSSTDAGVQAGWDLGNNGTVNTQGWDVTFLASKPGTYTVTLQAVDHFGGEYKTSTTVCVR